MRGRAEALYSTGAEVAGDAYGAEALGRTLSRRVRRAGRRSHHAAVLRPAGHRRRPTTTSGGGTSPTTPASRWCWTGGRRCRASFYRASVRDPQGVATRRRFGFVKGELTSFEDEHLDRGEELGTKSRILTAEIERPRVGPMRDIVATIQPEQDELVRAELADSICVQGAPGTGKTAVGLHRAAYLLYLHRERLRRSGVLIVGPNTAFLSYISAVLPALGEVEVQQATVDELIARQPVRADRLGGGDAGSSTTRGWPRCWPGRCGGG